MRYSGAIEQVRAYWEALCDGRQVPLRAEVDPRGIEASLEHAFILERIAPTIARFRLAGNHVNDVIGMEVRGMPLTSLFSPRARPGVAQRLEAAFQTPGALEMNLVGESGFAKPALKARMLLLPLASDLGDVSRALGCLVVEGSIGRTPRRFEVASARLTARYADGRSEDLGDALSPAAAAMISRREAGLAEAAATYHPAGSKPAGSGTGNSSFGFRPRRPAAATETPTTRLTSLPFAGRQAGSDDGSAYSAKSREAETLARGTTGGPETGSDEMGRGLPELNLPPVPRSPEARRALFRLVKTD